jgi:hypothetical protein
MAYMSQDKKAKLAPAIKELLKKHGMKGSIGVRHNSTLVINLSAGSLDIIGNYNDQQIERHKFNNRDLNLAETYLDVNTYYIHEAYTGEVKTFLMALNQACMTGNHNNSDIQSDYFDVGWYVDINVGKWDKPYQYIGD